MMSSVMTEFKRAKPKPMTDNWEEVGRRYMDEHYAITNTIFNTEEYYKIEDPRRLKREGGVDIAIVAKNETAYSFFETVIRCEKFLDVVKFYMDQDKKSYPPEDEDKRYAASLIKSAFIFFWVKEHVGLPVYLLDNAGRIYTHASEAVWAYLSGEEIEWCYALIDESIEFQLKNINLAINKSVIKSVERV